MADRALTVSLRQPGPIPLDVKFTCAPGDLLAIFGPSGSGKTTILRTIAGLYAPADAQVVVGGETWLDTSSGVARPPHRRAVGLVFQEYALFPHMTALANVMTALGHRPAGERRHRAEQLLHQVHLADHLDRRPSALSGGERQRVALARALAREPAVLLLDEPFAAVDGVVRRHLQDTIEELRATLDVPVVLVTHDFDDVLRLASHLLMMHRGTAVAVGPLSELMSRPDLEAVGTSAGFGSLFEATVSAVDAANGLVDLAFDGGTMRASARGVTTGDRLRVRVPAREVILATDEPRGLSLHNVLSGVVSGTHYARDSDHVVVQVTVGGVRLLAEVTPDVVARLSIADGVRLHLLIAPVSVRCWRPGVHAVRT